MSINKPWNSEQTEHLLNQLADSIEAATPSEIEQEILSSEGSLDAIVDGMKGAALAGIKKFQQRRLHQARQRYQTSSTHLEHRQLRVASTPDARRVQFFALVRANPGIQSGLTMQHRDLNALTDGDIESALEELDALGAVEKLGDGSNVPES